MSTLCKRHHLLCRNKWLLPPSTFVNKHSKPGKTETVVYGGRGRACTHPMSMSSSFTSDSEVDKYPDSVASSSSPLSNFSCFTVTGASVSMLGEQNHNTFREGKANEQAQTFRGLWAMVFVIRYMVNVAGDPPNDNIETAKFMPVFSTVDWISAEGATRQQTFI